MFGQLRCTTLGGSRTHPSGQSHFGVADLHLDVGGVHVIVFGQPVADILEDPLIGTLVIARTSIGPSLALRLGSRVAIR